MARSKKTEGKADGPIPNSKIDRIRKGADTKLAQKCRNYAHLLESGRVLSIDPSSGSAGSMPGFALFKGATLLESGELVIKAGDINTRLYSLARCLREDFSEIDLLIVEDLPPFMQTRGSTFRSKGTVNLHMSVGAIYSVFGYVPCIGVPPMAWHADERKLPFDYVKGDENDALMLAYAAFTRAEIKPIGLLEHLEEKCRNAKGQTEIHS